MKRVHYYNKIKLSLFIMKKGVGSIHVAASNLSWYFIQVVCRNNENTYLHYIKKNNSHNRLLNLIHLHKLTYYKPTIN